MDSGCLQKLIGFARIPVTMQESENKAALLLYRLLCWTMSGALLQNLSYMYIDSRNRYQMKVVTKSYIFNTLTLGPFITRMQQPKTQYGIGPINIIGNVKRIPRRSYMHTLCIYAYTHTCIHYYIHI